MSCVLGIDLGTSSVKAMLLDERKGVVDVVSQKYEVEIPQTGYAEQHPGVWWESVVCTIQRLKYRNKIPFAHIKGIGFSGQMHGLVVVDKDGQVIRPAILWLDQRTDAVISKMEQVLDMEEIRKVVHNRVSAGFAFPSVIWIKENEPENYERIHKILSPKDYIRFKMTAELGTDASDASSFWGMDAEKREWAWDIIRKFELTEGIFPQVHEAVDVAGEVTGQCARETGLGKGLPVVYGCGDQPAQSIGNGAIREGNVICNIGTGGQISTYSSRDVYDKQLRLHTFCHGMNQAYTIFGAVLCGGMSLAWLKDKVLCEDSFETLGSYADMVEPGSGGLIYLPYLSGERTPHMNPKARGMFFGLRLQHDKKNFARAVMEGVTFSLKDSLTIFQEMGLHSSKIIASGGGAADPVWLQIQADIFEKEVCVCNVKEQASLGACILAGVGCGLFDSVEEAADRFVTFDRREYAPESDAICSMYREQYEIFRELYKRNKDLMK